MEKQVELQGFNIKVLPIERLTKKALIDGYKYLKQIESVFDSGKTGFSAARELKDLSSDYYTAIPHNFGF